MNTITFHPFRFMSRKGLLGCLLLAALILSAFSSPSIAYAECVSTYIVKSGDTLSKIAAAHKVTLAELASANKITNINLVYVGQSLCIPIAGSTTGTPPKTTPVATTTASPSNSSSNFTAYHTAGQLSIELKNFATNTAFFVRVRVRTAGDLSKQWEKIGGFQTDKNGVGSGSFSLPSSLKDAGTISVCVKNVSNNALTCTSSTKRTNSNSGSGSSTPGSFTAAVRRDTTLTLNTNNLPKNSSFFVRVRNASSTNASDWVRVGTLTTGSSGSITASFALPKELQKYTALAVCIKNVSTNAVLCTTVSTNK